MNAKEKVTKGRISLILDAKHYFFGTLAMRLNVAEAEWCETMCTDGSMLYYNPSFVDSLTTDQVMGVLAHEVMHCALGHMWRGEGKDHIGWNIACDYKINQGLLNAGFQLPAGCLVGNTYDHLAEEEIYHRLPKGGGGKGEKKGKGGDGNGEDKDGKGANEGDGNGDGDPKGQDPGGCGGVMQQQGNKDERQQAKEEWKAAVAQAAAMSKNRGDLPADFALQIQDVLDPPLPWYVLLRDFVEQAAKNDYNWTRPNRRFVSNGIILPSLYSEELPEVIIVNDTSGSTIGYQGHFAKEASGVLSAYRTKIRVIYCDAKVHLEEEYETEDLPIKLKPVGGGGTSFIPAFDYIQEKGYMPSCLLFLTDLYGLFPAKAPEYPVMWITPNDQKAPFGVTVKFNVSPEGR